MAWIHPAAVEHRRKLFTRADAYRFAAPGTPEAKMPGWLDPSATRVRLKEAQIIRRCRAMNLTFFDVEDSANKLNGTLIRDGERLFQILDNLREREPPSMCELVGENGFKLVVGVGNDGCAQYSRADGSPPYLMAVTLRDEKKEGYTEFFAGGTLTPVWNRYCMPFGSVRQIVEYFQRTGSTHPAFRWEALSPEGGAEV